MNTRHHSPSHAKLIATAKKLRATNLQQAHGACLSASLELYALAKKWHIDSSLVMWHVRGDPQFCDHWAVRISPRQVIDLTHIQIDSKPTSEVVFDLTSYPKKYGKPCFYAADSLLDEYLKFKQAYPKELPPAFIKNIRSLILQQDWSHAHDTKNYLGLLAVLLSHGKFRFTFWLSQFKEPLQKKLKELTDN